ncbi:hypothetical protein Taro_055756, partial [Colocasia esculenta]|nr:hypothetical protein [Colocasia esculenta]
MSSFVSAGVDGQIAGRIPGISASRALTPSSCQRNWRPHCWTLGLASALLEFLLLWLVRDWISLLSLIRGSPPILF